MPAALKVAHHRQHVTGIGVCLGATHDGACGVACRYVGQEVSRVTAELHATRLGRREGVAGALGNQSAFLLTKGGVDMEGERVRVATELSDDEWHALSHEAADKVNIAAEAVELGDQDFATATSGFGERLLQFRP